MRRAEVVEDLLWWLCLATLLLPPCAPQVTTVSPSKYGKECDDQNLDADCGPFGRCKKFSEKTAAKCVCIQGYEYTNKVCSMIPSTEPPASSTFTAGSDSSYTGGSLVAAFLIIPTCFALIGALAYYSARRYKWLQRFRQFRQNRYGSVLVTRDDTDDDDPSLA